MNKINPDHFKFHNLLAEGNILCNTKSVTPESVILELCRLIQRNIPGYDAETVFKEVMLREKIMPTVVAKGLAIPHARVSSSDNLIIAMATSREGIVFENGKDPVHAVIVMLTPPDDPGLHLQVLAGLAKDFASNPKLVTDLANAQHPGEVIGCFTKNETAIPEFLRACDVMERGTVTLRENHTLKEAIEAFATSKINEFPVLDDEQELRGILSLKDLLKYGLPEHILWLDDLSSVYRFQPFSEVLQTADETKVADIMQEEFVSVREDIPAVQLAKLFLTKDIQKLMVINEQGKFAGVVDLRNFASRLFWE